MSIEATPGYPAPEIACMVVTMTASRPSVMKGRQREHEGNCRAVGVGLYQASVVATIPLLSRKQVEVIRIDLRNDERHVIMHPICRRVTDYRVAGLGEGLLRVECDIGWKAGKHEVAVKRRLAGLHHDRRDRSWHLEGQLPRAGFAKGLPSDLSEAASAVTSKYGCSRSICMRR